MIYAARRVLLFIRYKKWLVLGKFEAIMLSAQQIQQLLSEYESLQAQLEEANEILALREEELAMVREHAAEAAALRSQLDIHLDELKMMQNFIGRQQQKAAGAEERELELQQEITAAIPVQHQYNDLLQQYNYIATQLTDIQEELASVKKKNNMLQKIAVQVGELESTVENLTLERDALQAKLDTLENIQA